MTIHQGGSTSTSAFIHCTSPAHPGLAPNFVALDTQDESFAIPPGMLPISFDTQDQPPEQSVSLDGGGSSSCFAVHKAQKI